MIHLQTPITQTNTPLALKSTFDATGFSVSDVTTDAVNQYYGTAVNNLPYQYGASENMVSQIFATSNLRPVGANLSAEVSGFSTTVTCEKLKLEGMTQIPRPWLSIAAPYFVADFNTAGCSLSGVVIGQGADHGFFHRTGMPILCCEPCTRRSFLTEPPCGWLSTPPRHVQSGMHEQHYL